MTIEDSEYYLFKAKKLILEDIQIDANNGIFTFIIWMIMIL